MSGPSRMRAARLDPDTRRALIVDAAAELMTHEDPVLVTFEAVARAAGVSRALVHAYLGDRRGLIDAVQVAMIRRVDERVGDAVGRASAGPERVRALVTELFAVVAADRLGWALFTGTGGLEHPALTTVRDRWTGALVDEAAEGPAGDARVLAAQATVSALVAGVGGWVDRAVDPDRLLDVLVAGPRSPQMPNSAARTAATASAGPASSTPATDRRP